MLLFYWKIILVMISIHYKERKDIISRLLNRVVEKPHSRTSILGEVDVVFSRG